MKIAQDKYHWVESLERDEEVKIELTGVKKSANGHYYITGEYNGNHFKQNIGDWDSDLKPGWYIMKCTAKKWNEENHKYYHHVEFNPIQDIDSVMNGVVENESKQTRLDEHTITERYGQVPEQQDYTGKQADDVFPTRTEKTPRESNYQSEISQQMREEWNKQKQELINEQNQLQERMEQLHKEKEMIDYILQGGKV